MTLNLHLKKGALHKTLGIAAGKKIPLSRERKAAHSGSKLERKRAQFAINARKWHHEDVELNERVAAKKSFVGKLISKITGKGKPKRKQSSLVVDKTKKFAKGSGSGVTLKNKKPGSLSSQTNSLRKTFGVAPGKRFKNKPLNSRSKRTTTLVKEETLHELSKRLLTRYANASHESSLDDIKKFPDRLEGEQRALDRLKGKFKVKQSNGMKKRVKYRAEDVNAIFEGWFSDPKKPTTFVPNSFEDGEQDKMNPRFDWKDKYGNISPKRKRDLASFKSRENMKSPDHNKQISDKQLANMKSNTASLNKYHKDNPTHGFMPQITAANAKQGLKTYTSDDIKANKPTHDIIARTPPKRKRKVNEGIFHSFKKYITANSRKNVAHDKTNAAMDKNVANYHSASDAKDKTAEKKTIKRAVTLGKRMSALKTDSSGNFFMPDWPKKPKDLKYMGSK